jgi:hypothetical protein
VTFLGQLRQCQINTRIGSRLFPFNPFQSSHNSMQYGLAAEHGQTGYKKKTVSKAHEYICLCSQWSSTFNALELEFEEDVFGGHVYCIWFCICRQFTLYSLILQRPLSSANNDICETEPRYVAGPCRCVSVALIRLHVRWAINSFQYLEECAVCRILMAILTFLWKQRPDVSV